MFSVIFISESASAFLTGLLKITITYDCPDSALEMCKTRCSKGKILSIAMSGVFFSTCEIFI